MGDDRVTAPLVHARNDAGSSDSGWTLNFPHLWPDFADLLECFMAERVDFLLVGAFALAANGVVRATTDMDVWVRPNTENAKRTLAALARFGAPIEQHGVTAADFDHPDSVYQIGLPPMRIDVLTSIDGVNFEEAWQNRVVIEIGGLRLFTLSLGMFIQNKRAAGRPRDLQDLAMLRAAGVDVSEG